MPIIEKEVGVLEMWLLIRQGVLLEFQTFLSEAKGKKQVFRTKVAKQGILYTCYHHASFPFMISAKGQIILDGCKKRFLDSLD